MSHFISGQIFARYRIEALLGEGGMGQVYRAHDTLLRRRVAVKVLLPREGAPADPQGKGEAASRILREARAAAALNHRSAVAIFDVGEVDGVPFIAMELVEGRTLREYVGDHGVALDRRLRWLVDVAEVLGAAHSAGLVHRDVKPENVMVCRDGSVRVLDFGIARRTEVDAPSIRAFDPQAWREASLHTTEGRVRGTPRYMAPEQILGAEIDGRSDQYAWAVTAYELLSGAHPAGPSGLLIGVPKLLNEVVPGVPSPVAAAVARALSPTPEARHPSIDEIVRVLEPFAASPNPRHSATEGEGVSLPSVEPGPTKTVRSTDEDFPKSSDVITARARPRARTLRGALPLAIAALAAVGLAVWGGVRWGTRARVTPAASATPTSSNAPSWRSGGLPMALIFRFENRTSDPVSMVRSRSSWNPR
jgi:serine/threonine protein kinase